MARFNSIRLLGDREFAALAGTAFARSQAYSTILIALALYAATEVGFLLAAGFIVLATGGFVLSATRAHRQRTGAGDADPVTTDD